MLNIYYNIMKYKKKISPKPLEKSGVLRNESWELYPRSLISTGAKNTPTGHKDSAFCRDKTRGNVKNPCGLL